MSTQKEEGKCTKQGLKFKGYLPSGQSFLHIVKQRVLSRFCPNKFLPSKVTHFKNWIILILKPFLQLWHNLKQKKYSFFKWEKNSWHLMWKNFGHLNLSATLVKDQKWPLSHLLLNFGNRYEEDLTTGWERGMASNPKMEYVPGFSWHFPKEISYGYLRFEGNGKILLGR